MNNIAVVVTFNKKEMLSECVEALLNQSIPLDKIIVFDNASTDGTKDYLQSIQYERLETIFSEKNLGGAGGFNQAIKEGMKFNPNYIWIMDDDSIVEANALEELLKAKDQLNNQFGFLSSNVLWIDRTPCLMNIQKVAKVWNSKAVAGLIQLETASFVSLFVNTDAIKSVGYPISDFFIWGDDIEYTQRISRELPSYFVPNSVVIHKMNENTEVDILKDNKDRIPRYYYDIRNKFYRFKQMGKKELFKYILKILVLVIKVVFSNTPYKMLKLKTIFKGFISGITFNPSIEFYENKS